jgi:O-antigen/teichoic acid export membrane protein
VKFNIKKMKDISKSKFVRSLLLVMTGTAGAQAITMLFAPIVTSLYGPELFGILGSFVGVLAVATSVAALTYPTAIVLPKSDDDARGIVKLSLLIAFVVTSIFSVIIFIAGEQIAQILSLESIADFLFFIPLAVFFSALQQIMQQWLIRKKQFKVIARVAISQAFILNSSKAGCGFLYPSSFVLVFLTTVSSALWTLQLWFASNKWSAPQDKIQSSVSRQVSIKSLAYRHRDFPFYRAPQVFINALSHSLPVLMLAVYFGPVTAGLYALAGSVMALPSTLLGQAVTDVFYPRIAEAANNKENLYPLVLKATLGMACVGIIPYGVVFIWGPLMFGFVFGEEWFIAGEYASWISVWLFFAFMNRPSVSALAVLKLQGLFLIYEIGSTLLRAAGLFVGFIIFNDANLAVALFSIGGVLSNSFLIGLTLIKSR